MSARCNDSCHGAWGGITLLTAIFAAVAAGCSAHDSKGRVQGTVTLDGAPLAAGGVRFVPVSGQSPTAGAAIVDGHFSAEVAPGAMRLEFSAPKVVGKKRMFDDPNSREVDIVEERLPARYNVKSELTMDVQAGAQERQFDLKMK